MNLSIFNFNSWKTIATLWPWRAIVFAIGCAAWLAVPFFGMDAVDVPVWLIAVLGWLVALVVFFPAYRRYLSLFVFTVLAGLVVMEAVFRVRYFNWAALNVSLYRPAGYPHPWSLFEFSPDTYTGVKSGEIIYKGYPFRINRDGFRGADRSYAKPPDTKRVVVAGTSVGMGAGVGGDDVFTSHMERRLNERGDPGRRVQVINLSVGGNFVGNMLHDLDAIGRRYEPDVLLLCLSATRLTAKDALVRRPFVMKELEESLAGKVLKRRYEFFSNRSFVLALLVQERRNLMNKWRGGAGSSGQRFRQLDAFLAEQSEEAGRVTAQVLTEFKELAASMNAHPVVYLTKPVLRIGDPDHDRAYRDMIQTHADQVGIPVLDSYRASYPLVHERRLIAYPGDSHPNAIMHRVMGEYFADELAPLIAGR